VYVFVNIIGYIILFYQMEFSILVFTITQSEKSFYCEENEKENISLFYVLFCGDSQSRKTKFNIKVLYPNSNKKVFMKHTWCSKLFLKIWIISGIAHKVQGPIWHSLWLFGSEMYNKVTILMIFLDDIRWSERVMLRYPG
jgi:hypothetical protein